MSPYFRKSFSQSLTFHLLLIVIVVGLTLINPIKKNVKKYKFSVLEKTIGAPEQQKPIAALDITQQPKLVETQKIPPKKVFGLNKNTITSSDVGAAIEVKAGNTISKEQDNEILEGNADPIPVAEFLVTKMPLIKKEVRASYPAEARSKNIQGVVLIDILIDESGKVHSAELFKGLGFGLDEAALAALKQFEFDPARVDQKTVAVKIRYAYRFVLDE